MFDHTMFLSVWNYQYCILQISTGNLGGDFRGPEISGTNSEISGQLKFFAKSRSIASTGLKNFSFGNPSGNFQCPEISGHCPEISESPKIFHQVQIVKRYCLSELRSRNFRCPDISDGSPEISELQDQDHRQVRS